MLSEQDEGVQTKSRAGMYALLGMIAVVALAYGGFRVVTSGKINHESQQPVQQQTQRVGREFASMDQCLTFIMKNIGDSLEFITDKPGDISGRSTKKKLFYRCELRITGTRGPVLEGRWDQPIG